MTTENTVTPVALITGASRGIGAEIARTLASKGFDIVIVYYTSEPVPTPVKEECEKIRPGIRVIMIPADVTLEDDCKNVIQVTKDTFGRIDVLVNNAGMTKDGLAMRMSLDQFTTVINTNLTSAFLLSSLSLSMMAKQKSGRIINMSSVSGVYGNPGQSNYSASKAGLIGLTKSLAKEMGSRNITVNAIAPGFIDTPMTAPLSDEVKKGAIDRIALGRFGQPKDVANLVAFLASDDAAYITGQVIEVAGGLTL
jgi:3-oxoacyl-[acyl-carrier protein] reductase